jgi:hypothetical protein
MLKPMAITVRHILKKRPKYIHQFDGVATLHNLDCLNEPRFQYALSQSISAGGFDYRIYMRQHQAIWAADYALRRNPQGIFVELGTAKGYFMTSILASFEYLGTDLSQTQVLLFDSFVSSATDNKNSQRSENGKNIYYAENVDQVKKTFSKYKNVRINQGVLPSILNSTEIKPISLIHIDLNAPEIEIECLKKLWEKILPGGLILIDDYAYSGFDYTNRLFNAFAKEFNVSILTTAWGPGVIIK